MNESVLTSCFGVAAVFDEQRRFQKFMSKTLWPILHLSYGASHGDYSEEYGF
jgi:hypothetical protein